MESILNCILNSKAQFLITCKSLFNTLCDLYLSKTCEKGDVSSAKKFTSRLKVLRKIVNVDLKEGQEQITVALQILSTPKRRSDY